ncbi:MAG: nucleoside-triphosphatase [Ferruginibacter sp.]
MNQPILILTGPVHSGKTTLLLKWISQQKKIAGILTPVIEGTRSFLDIETGQSFSMNATGDEQQALTVGKFRFSEKNFSRASAILKKAVNSQHNFLIIDEIGPLELKQHKGFYEALVFILTQLKDNCRLLLLVRDNCLPDMELMINFYNFRTIIYTADTFSQLPAP